MTDICRYLDLMKGSERNARPAIKYLTDSLNVPEHKENLINLGFDPSEPPLRKQIPYPAVHYIMETVFRQILTK